ncbi:hypothetical protein K9U40_03515 [Xanthobacter autotrophicus]|nr:hypothetical protein [Xanthobacter autotrophicus]MDI4663412.1 hypothetical protein [Xanthobacter autotrophicus]
MSANTTDAFDTPAFQRTLGVFATGVAIVAAEGGDGTAGRYRSLAAAAS